MPRPIIDLVHQRFCKWFVLQHGPSSKTGRSRWLCRCDCGTTKLVQSSHLRRGLSTQCRACAKFQGYKQISLSYWNHLINGAKKRDYEFNITIEEAWEQFLKQKSKCVLTGQNLVFARNYGTDLQTASFDRIDSSKGYVADNIQWVHKDINMLKGKLSQKEFIWLCQLVTDYQISKISEPINQSRSTTA